MLTVPVCSDGRKADLGGCAWLLQVGRQEPVMVLRVDKEKGYIDLSKRRVSPEDIAASEEKFNKSKMVHSIMRHTAETTGSEVRGLKHLLRTCTTVRAWFGHTQCPQMGTAQGRRSSARLPADSLSLAPAAGAALQQHRLAVVQALRPRLRCLQSHGPGPRRCVLEAARGAWLAKGSSAPHQGVAPIRLQVVWT